MNPVSFLGMEVKGFLYLLAALLAYRLLTRQINLSGLLGRTGSASGPGSSVSPERVQLLLATLALSAKFLGDAIHTTNATMPDINPQWLIVYGSSSGIYASIKAFTTLRLKKI